MKKRIEIYDDSIGAVEYIDHLGSDLTIVNSARVSFGKQKITIDKKDEKLIRYLIENNHTSTLEHNVVTFRFIVPLFVRSQHHRHRTWSYNEISRRYTDADITFYSPTRFRTQHKSNRQSSNTEEMIDPEIGCYVQGENKLYKTSVSHAMQVHHKDCYALYKKILDSGVCREQARGILPQNMYTEYYGTVNLNNLFKFIDLRIHEGAQLEIQKVATACLEISKDLWPIAISAYGDIHGLSL